MEKKGLIAGIIIILLIALGYVVYLWQNNTSGMPVEGEQEAAALIFTSDTEKITFDGPSSVKKPNNLVIHVTGEVRDASSSEFLVSLAHSITPPINDVTITVAASSTKKIDHYLTINTSATSTLAGSYTLTSNLAHSTTTPGGVATYSAAFPFTISTTSTQKGK